MKRAEIRSLTGLRGVCAFLVMVFHLGFLPASMAQVPVGRFFARGYLWVDLFFALSGYIMAEVHAGDFARRFRPAAYWRFLRLRLARVYPLYLAVTLVAFEEWPFPWRWGDLLTNLVLAQQWFGHWLSFVGPAWSLSTEMLAYLLFPLIVRLVLQERPVVAAILYGVAILVLVRITTMPIEPGHFFTLSVFTQMPATIARCFAGFTIGMIAWRIGRAPWLHDRLGGARASGLVGAAVIASLAYGVSDVAIVVVLFPCLILTLVHGRGGVVRLLGSPVAHRLGVWSFAIYLGHLPVALALLRFRATGLFGQIAGHGAFAVGAGNIATWLVVLCLCPVLHHGIEVPGRRLLSGRRRAPAPIAGAPVPPAPVPRAPVSGPA